MCKDPTRNSLESVDRSSVLTGTQRDRQVASKTVNVDRRLVCSEVILAMGVSASHWGRRQAETAYQFYSKTSKTASRQQMRLVTQPDEQQAPSRQAQRGDPPWLE